MAARDIMPWISPRGGTYEVRWGPLFATAEVFFEGEPVNTDPAGAGTYLEPPDDQSEWVLADMDTVGNVCGIAAAGPGAANINPQTGNTYVVGDAIPYWPADQGTLFITRHFSAAGDTTTAVVPAQTDVGEIYQINNSATAGIGLLGWGLEQDPG
ncbi:unnamed protein product, partial [marine sediment metagenome]